MALGTTNISFNALNQEFDRTATAEFSLADTRLRAMAGGITTNIGFSALQNKAGVCQLTVSTGQSVQYNVAAQAASAGYDKTYQKLQVTVNSGVTVYGGAEKPSYPAAMYFNGAWLGGANSQTYGIYLVNDGTIVGQGGQGALGPYSYSIAGGSDFGQPGGQASAGIRADQCTVNVTNNGSIVGGSGGGASGRGSGTYNTGPWYGGSGGGGGAPHGLAGAGGAGGTASGNSGSAATYSNGGAGGTPRGGSATSGYTGGNFGAVNGGGISIATYAANLQAFILCDGYAAGAGVASASATQFPGTINWLVNGTRIGAIS